MTRTIQLPTPSAGKTSSRSLVIPYAPRRAFREFHARTQRFAIGVAHRRAGKTVGCLNDQIRKAIRLERAYPPGRFAYIAPFFNQAKDVAWAYLKHYAAPALAKVNEGDCWVELANGSRIRVYGADNPDRLRGGYLDDALLDEYADMHPAVWGTIIRPMLADYKGTATFIGTPKGRNAFSQLYEQAERDPEWFRFFLPASVTGILPESELAAARRDMTPEEFDQEFECSFDAAIKGAYFGKEIAEAERQGRVSDVLANPSLPVHTAWDLGMGDSTAIWLFQVSAGEIRIIDHYENHGQTLSHYVAELEARGHVYGTDWVPHDARVRSLETGRTRVETLAALGRKPALVPDHKLMDGINAARLALGRCWFDKDHCKDGLEALRQYRTEYDDKTKAYKDKPRHDWTSHTADAFRYLAMAYRAVAQPAVAAPKPHVTPLADMTHDDWFAAHATSRKTERV